MKLHHATVVAMLASTALTVAACSSSATDTATSSTSKSATSTSTKPSTNKRGAVEVDLGQPVTLRDQAGKPIITITDTRLDTTGCRTINYRDIPQLASEGATGEIRQAKFIGTVKVGDIEEKQWLWSSDFYFVAPDGEIADNLTVSQLHDDLAGTICEGETSIIDLPPNSTAKGATTIDIPVGTEKGGPVAIGYKVDGKRIEWKLPGGAAKVLGPAPTPATTTAAEVIPEPTTEPQAPAVEEPTTDYPRGTVPGEGHDFNNGLPPEWDKNGDGMIDKDAPIGDGDCDNPQCLMGPNG